MAAIARLSWADLNNLALEAEDTPMHQAVLASLDAAPLRDAAGRVRLTDIRAHLAARIGRVPEMRRVLYRPGFLHGRPVWIDDPSFDIENHVLLATLPAPGGEAAALAFASSEMAALMDRSMPLWRLWVLDGYSNDRVAILIKLHHALADGPAMVNMLAQVFDLEPAALERPTCGWSPQGRPTGGELLRDGLKLKARAAAKTLRRVAQPARSIRAMVSTMSAAREAFRSGRGAPRTSLNRPIGTSRVVGALHLSLAEMKEVAHCHDATVNDVFLALAAGGLRRVLLSRGEPVAGASIRASMAVSLHRGDHSMTGNNVGTVIVPLPVDIESTDQLLPAVAAATALAKTKQLPADSTRLMVVLARLGITRAFIRRQHMINVLTTNLPGPPVAFYLAGARLHDPVAMPPIAGNVTVSFAALSYDGGVTLSVIAERASWPDLDFLLTSMRACWLELRSEEFALAHLAV